MIRLGERFRQYDVGAFEEPRFTGTLERAPDLLEAVQKQGRSLAELRSKYEVAAERLAEVVTLASAPNPDPRAGSVTILHVSDISNPHHDELDEEVDKILHELGVADRPRLRVLNKVDLLTAEQRESLASASQQGSHKGPVLVSGMTGEGIDELLRRIDVALPIDPMVTLSLRLPLAEGRTLALIHAMGRVLHSSVEDSHMTMEAEVPVSMAQRLRLNQFAVQETFRP